MNKFESKFRNTALKMNDALLRLMESKRFNEITVSEVCKEANVNRSTFYLHYNNIYDLLCEIKDSMIKKFLARYDKKTALEDLKNYKADEVVFNSPKYIVPYLEFVKANKKIFSVFMAESAGINWTDDKNLNLKGFLASNIIKNGLYDEKIIRYMSKFYLTGIISITSEWLKNDCSDEIPFVCEIIALCTRHRSNTLKDK